MTRTVGFALASLAVMGLVACGSGTGQAESTTTGAPQTVVVVSEVPASTTASTAAPAPAPTAAPAPTTVVVVQPQTPRTVVKVVPQQGSTSGAVSVPSYVEPGDYCKWLGANGYSFSEAQATYYALGSPGHMDADKNGIPCETVYG